MSGLPKAVSTQSRSLSVRVLGDEAHVDGQKVDAVLSGEVVHPLIACLAEAWPRFMRRRDITERMGHRFSDDALQKQMSRLRANHGVPIESKREQGYRLDADEVSLDLREFMSQGGKALETRSTDAARAALDSWSGELPAGVARSPIFKGALELRADVQSLAILRPKRVLVVEDMLGAELEQGLHERYRGEIDVLVATSYEQFLEVEEDLYTFDAVLVDFHLGGNDDQFRGLTVADRIKGGDVVIPVMGMSWARPGRRDDEHTALKYDLWAFVAKGSSSDTSAVDDIVATTIAFMTSPSTMVEHYAQRTEALARRAKLRIASDRPTPKEREVRMEQMAKELNYLRNARERNDLKRLRRLSHGFYERWCR